MRSRSLVQTIFVLLAACSGDGDATPGAGASAAAEPYTLPTKPKIGSVDVFVRPESPGDPPSFYAAAYFVDYAAKGGALPDGFSRGESTATDCTKRSAGGCDLVRCKLVSDPGLTFATPAYETAGTVTVKRASGGELDMTPDVQNTYNASLPAPDGAAAGETVTVTAAGGDVPAFSETIPFASGVAPASSRVEVPAGSDAEIAWTGGANGRIVVRGEAGDESKGFVAVLTCHFDAAPGKGTVPGGVLVDMAGNDFALGIGDEPLVKDVGGYEVSFVAQTSADVQEDGLILSVK